jgi:Tfp pilus assembly protein PilF
MKKFKPSSTASSGKKAPAKPAAKRKTQGGEDEITQSAAFRKALQLQPDCADCQNKIGEVLRATGKLDEASAAFKAAILLKKDLAVAHFNPPDLLILLLC